MSATALLMDLDRLGIRLEADGGRLRYVPRSAVTPDVLVRLKSYKADLLAMLSGSDGIAAARRRPLSRDERRWLIGEAIDRLNAAYDGGSINWPALDDIEQRIETARTGSELTAALADYEAVAGCREPQDRQSAPESTPDGQAGPHGAKS